MFRHITLIFSLRTKFINSYAHMKQKINGIEDLDVRSKRIILRVDFNCPVDGDGQITDPARIVKSLPTVEYLLKNAVHH